MAKFSVNDYFGVHKLSVDIYNGDCVDVLPSLKPDFVDLVVTSPPYADQRKKNYNSITPDHYVEWFTPIGKELLRVLKPDGTFILNIKEKVVNGERHTYVIDLIKRMREIGWLWTEEFIWHKKTSFPGKWPNRFRDAWERLLQFNKSRKFNMYQNEVMVDIGDWAEKRIPNLSQEDHRRRSSVTGSGLSRKVSNWANRTKVYPTNVLHLSSETSNKDHPAVFPDELPEWFIKLFTKENDVVLDPFMGSGTTLITAYNLKRESVGIEKEKIYYDLAQKEIEKCIASNH